MMQRFFDILFSLISIIFLLPIFIIIILILSLTGEREIFYIQNRVGLNGANFGVIKFATMIKTAHKLELKQSQLKMIHAFYHLENFLEKQKLMSCLKS